MNPRSQMRGTSSPAQAACLVQASWGEPPSGARHLELGPHAVGWDWRDALGRWCLLTQVVSGAPGASSAEQTRLVLERMSASLNLVGMGFRQVVRTWFFLDEILAWYDTFNHVRTEFFERYDLLDRMPASTAVGPTFDGEPRILAGLLALRPASYEVAVRLVASPAQGSAFEYGSSFSRAAEVSWPEGRRLYVSGTASIDSAGRTLHAGDFSKQAEETFRVVGQLLESRGLSFRDVEQAVCYVARERDVSRARLHTAEHLSQRIPTVTATVCRSDLEFEIELVASRELAPDRSQTEL